MTIVIRADASAAIGTGHIVRTATLAQRLARYGATVVYAVRTCPQPLHRKLCRHSFEVHALATDDPDELAALVRDRHAAAVILDHYGLDSAFEQRFKALCPCPLMVIDDLIVPHDADILLNPNLYAEPSLYRGLVPDSCRIMAGPRYALLRDEFRALPPRERETRESVRLLITLGGSDPDNRCAELLEALRPLTGIREITLIAGSANLGIGDLRRRAAAFPVPLAILESVDDMARHMDQADLLICAAGGTVLEALAVGIPFAHLVIAGNQERVSDTLVRQGLSIRLDAADLAGSLRGAIAAYRGGTFPRPAAWRRIIGADDPAKRLLCAVYRPLFAAATADDARTLFDLTNDPVVRNASFSTRPVSWDEHIAWLDVKLADPACRLWIVRSHGLFLGTVRIDRGIISIALHERARGCRLAAPLIAQACRRHPGHVTAHVKPENTASLAAFTEAGFQIVAQNDDMVTLTFKGGA